MFTQEQFEHIADAVASGADVNLSGESTQFELLYGHMSCKQFYRFRYHDVSYILVVIPNRAPSADEYFIPECLVSAGEVFYATSKWMNAHLKGTPSLLVADESKHYFVISDAGKLSLYDWLQSQNGSADTITQYYQRAIDWIIELQSQSNHFDIEGLQLRALNHQTLFREMLEFSEFADASDSQGFSEAVLPLLARIAQLPRTLVHRDYHSRNIMVQDGKLCVIDFQDMCYGPIYYDLASLLYDPYVDLSESIQHAITEYYYDRAKSHEWFVESDLEDFNTNLQLVVIQRLLKAAGRYRAISAHSNNQDYLAYYDVAIKRARQLMPALDACIAIT